MRNQVRIKTTITRVQQIFGEQWEDIEHVLQGDRAALMRSEYPSYLPSFSALVPAGLVLSNPSVSPIPLADLGRTNGHPRNLDCELQRVVLESLLEAGATALRQLSATRLPRLTPQELLALECLLLIYGRPPLTIDSHGELQDIPATWNILADQREEIELVQRAVGRIALRGHPDYDWAATGFLVSETCLLTTRRAVETFAELDGDGHWRMHPRITAAVNFQAHGHDAFAAGLKIRSVLGVHDQWDVAFLEIEPAAQSEPGPLDLDFMVLAAEPPAQLVGRHVYLVSYPVRDSRGSEPQAIADLFGHVYRAKCVQPGRIVAEDCTQPVGLLRHDCGMLGTSQGGCLVDLETHHVLGVHLGGRYQQPGVAVPVWAMRDQRLINQVGATFTDSLASEEWMSTLIQMRQLARSHLWQNARKAIGQLHRDAFGNVRQEESESE